MYWSCAHIGCYRVGKDVGTHRAPLIHSASVCLNRAQAYLTHKSRIQQYMFWFEFSLIVQTNSEPPQTTHMQNWWRIIFYPDMLDGNAKWIVVFFLNRFSLLFLLFINVAYFYFEMSKCTVCFPAVMQQIILVVLFRAFFCFCFLTPAVGVNVCRCLSFKKYKICCSELHTPELQKAGSTPNHSTLSERNMRHFPPGVALCSLP